jgi:DNA invertase Pin-like site-specific DNA recombinase
MERYVAYYRVSTQRQGQSGLGLEAQQAAVAQFLAGRKARVVAEHTEVESGRRRDRPELQAAIETARAHGATLLVAKLDRLTRDPALLYVLRDAGVDIAAADLPGANRLTIGVLALVAEQEAEAISVRTKAALAARKARGLPLGNQSTLRPGTPAIAAAASTEAASKAQAHRDRVRPIVERLRASGLSLRAVAAQLDVDGVPTARGGRWTAAQVSRVLAS